MPHAGYLLGDIPLGLRDRMGLRSTMHVLEVEDTFTRRHLGRMRWARGKTLCGVPAEMRIVGPIEVVPRSEYRSYVCGKCQFEAARRRPVKEKAT